MDEPRIDFLEDEAPQETIAAEVEAPAAETPAEPATVATPVIPATEVPTTPEPKEDHVPLAALRAERQKRQEYEARLRQYEQQAQQQPQPSFHEQPEQYLHGVLQQHEAQITARMLGALEAQAKEVYPDYDDVFAVVADQAAGNPVLVQQIMQSPNPAMAAYKLGKQLREMEAMKDPAAYRQQIEAEVRASIEAEMVAKEAARLKAVEAIPPNLADVRASKDSEVLPDDSLDSILKSKR
jgi:hypothetical protein